MAALFSFSAMLGCDPTVPSLPGTAVASEPPHVVLFPDASPDLVPPVVRVRVVPEPGAFTDVSRLLFVIGHVGPAHVRQVENDEVSNALFERVVPASTWLEEDGSAVIAPTVVLEAGETYGVLSGDPALGVELHVDPADPVPVLARTWPPVDSVDSVEAGAFAIFCGDRALATPPAEVELAPHGLAAVVQGGASAGIEPRCLRVDAAPEGLAALAALGEPAATTGATSTAPRGVPPPLVTLADGSLVRLDPATISLALPTSPPAPAELVALACEPGEIQLGPGCARVADDRLFVTSPEAPLLWALASPAAGGDVWRVTAAGEPWVLLGLPPSASAELKLVTVEASGLAHPCALELHTEPPMAHLVISEVLANPLGSEPDQEWVELTNDGLVAADLAGYVLADIGGETALPAAVLAPGAFALVVNETFVEDDELDPVPAPGTLLLRVPKLGKTGLKNDGEPLKLIAPNGVVVSRFPAAPKPKAGMSLARLSASAPDGDPASFAAQPPTPGAANAPSP